jgi:hypothetical protein
MPETKFTDKTRHPGPNDVKRKIGKSYHLLDETISALQSGHKEISADWKFSNSSGWYLTYQKKKRRLFYLFPQDDNFVFKIVLNDKCLKLIGEGAFPQFVLDMIKDAKRYPEGTLCVFDKTNYRVDTILELLRIKMGN